MNTQEITQALHQQEKFNFASSDVTNSLLKMINLQQQQIELLTREVNQLKK